MKKLFVCAMALAAFVSCSKDDVQGPALDSKNKSIEIKIANASTGTRADGGNTAAGDDVDCAKASELKVLFANSAGLILNELDLDDQASADNHIDGTTTNVGEYTPGYTEAADTYIWHNVNWAVTKIAVVRYESTDFPNGTNGLNLSEVLEKATSETANLARDINDIVLYGEGTLYDTDATHRINDIVYHVWQADVIVAPAFARFEINNFQCTDLGDANHDFVKDADGKYITDEEGNYVPDHSTYGFDELAVTSLTWNGTYTAPNFKGTLYGSYDPETCVADPNTCPDGEKRVNYMKATNGVWSWNVAPNTIFDELVVEMTASAYDYTINTASVPLKVIDLKGAITGNKFEAGHIYTLDLSFEEKNIIDPEGLCVVVDVTIVPWQINVVEPVFDKN